MNDNFNSFYNGSSSNFEGELRKIEGHLKKDSKLFAGHSFDDKGIDNILRSLK